MAAATPSFVLEPALRAGIWFAVASWTLNRMQTVERYIEHRAMPLNARVRWGSGGGGGGLAAAGASVPALGLPRPYPSVVSSSVIVQTLCYTLVWFSTTMALYTIIILDGGSSFYYPSMIIHTLIIEAAVLWAYTFYRLRYHVWAMAVIGVAFFAGVISNIAFVSTQSSKATLLMAPLVLWIGTLAYHSVSYSLAHIRTHTGDASGSVGGGASLDMVGTADRPLGEAPP